MSFNQGSVSLDTPSVSGAPFTPQSARNGLSVDSAGFIVLGQIPGASGDPAQLLNDRQIPMKGFDISFLGSTGAVVDINDDHIEEGGLNSPDAYVGWIGTPNNYGTVYAGHGVADRFYGLSWERFDGVNTYPRPNVVGQFWAYNYSTGGSTINGAEAGFGFRTETDFDLNESGSDTFELHLPEVAVPSGLTFRPWSFYIDKTTGATIHQSQVQSFNFNTKNENLSYLTWDCNTSGSNPGEDRTMDMTWTARGSDSSTTILFDDQDGTFAPFTLQWERGTVNMTIGSGTSADGAVFNITGSLEVTGAPDAGTSIIQCFTRGVDQATFFSAQIFSDTFNNNPNYNFDRRLASGSTLIGDGNNGGEITWVGDRNLNISGIANGIGGGVHQCFDLEISGFDTDDVIHQQMLIARNGNTTLRGGLETGDPGSGAGLWMLGQQQTAVVTVNLGAYVEVNIDGTIVKLIIAN